jgi:hypothetical protein
MYLLKWRMAILQPKMDKLEKDPRIQVYDINNISVDINALPLEDKIQWHKQT